MRGLFFRTALYFYGVFVFDSFMFQGLAIVFAMNIAVCGVRYDEAKVNISMF